MVTNNCNINYQSKYAYINNKIIHIDNINELNKCNLKCKLGHELIPVKGKKNVHHFRHKHKEDLGGNPMTEWHAEWQGNFPITEIDFLKINDTQNKNRRVDVILENSNLILEFQHSKIEESEVNNRKYDYELHNKQIIWIIDGNNFINKTYLEYSNRIYLEFVSDFWKYKSFLEYDYIFIDINEEIYKIYPKEIKSNMIDVELPFAKADFINYLNNNDKIIYQINIPLQTQLYIKCMGAGNGKTYGIFQMLQSQEFIHYKYFIMITKQHSAKSVMFSEFKDHIKNGNLIHITNITEQEINKKYIIKYTNLKTNSVCQIIIATVDSLMYCLGNKYHNELNKFVGIVNSIVDGYIENKNNITFGSINLNLNKEVCLICDETQDLTINYAKAIIQIMRNKYIDSYIVGDKLQSIMFKDNALTYLIDNNFSYINKHEYDKVNICRRFYNKELVNFVNSIVPFSNHNLIEIKPWKETTEIENDSLIFITGKTIYATDTDENKINISVVELMKLYSNDVEQNNYKPNDFLIITPFTNKNPLVNALEVAIDMFWNNKYQNNNYNRYAIFHKSEEGSSIDITESDDATRIVSIHTSKGDGRPIVFLIGLTEQALIKFSGESNNLVYDSLIHVAITRMKKKLYIRIENNGDDICKKIDKYLCDNNIESNIIPILNISENIKYNNIIDSLQLNNIFEKLKYEIIDNTKLNDTNFVNNENQIIDMGHHNIRYASMLIYLFIKIILNENKLDNIKIKKQILIVFKTIKDSEIIESDKWQDYNNHLKEKKLCILKISNNGKDYIKYYDIIKKNIINLQQKINDIINGKNIKLCPYESIILHYMIQITDQGIYSQISINDLYNITDIYLNSYTNNLDGHKKCLCNICFIPNNILKINNENMKTYLKNHYEIIKNIGKIYNQFLLEYPKINWLINHKIKYGSDYNSFNLYKYFNLIGYDKDNVFIFYIKPQFNNLNYNNILLESIFDTYLIKSIKKSKNESRDDKEFNDYKKFYNKKIMSIVFSLNNNNYYPISWINKDNINLIESNNNIIINLINDSLINKYIIESKHIYNFYKYWEKNIEINEKILQPIKIIKRIINIYKNNQNYDKMPHFILKFFERIETYIDICKSIEDKKQILVKYLNKDNFIDEINEIIKNSINEYLGIDE